MKVDAQRAYVRVDAARRLMHVPARAAEATGRLFFAKRLHEAAKTAPGQAEVDLDALLAEVLADLASEAARQGARAERAHWDGPGGAGAVAGAG